MTQEIPRLPDEVLDKIFSMVSHPEDRRRLALTSKLCHRIIRKQSSHWATLIVKNFDPNQDPILLFKNKEIFPFSKIVLYAEYLEIRLSRALELIARYFPTLKQLKIVADVHWEKLNINVNLPVEELDLTEADIKDESFVDHLIWRCPRLRRLMVSDQMKCLVKSMEKLNPNLKERILAWQTIVEDFEVTYRIHGPSIFDVNTLRSLEQVKNFGTFSIDLKYMTEIDRWTENTQKSFFSQPRKVEVLQLKRGENVSFEFLTMIQRQTSVKILKLDAVLLILRPLDAYLNFQGLQEIHLKGSSHLLQSSFSSSACSKVTSFVLDSMNHRMLYNLEQFLSKCKNLRHLDLKCIRITNKTLQIIIQNCSKLRSLKIHFSEITDNGLIGKEMPDWRPISDLKNLEELVLRSRGVFSDIIFNYGVKLPRLKLLDMIKLDEVSLDGLKNLAANCPDLETIFFTLSKGIDDFWLEFIVQNFRYLKLLKICHCSASKKKIGEIQEKCPNLTIVYYPYEVKAFQ